MNKLGSILCALLFLLTVNSLKAGSSKSLVARGVNNDTLTVTFMVNGTSACKSNIEAVVSSQTGVISAVWNSSTKQMTVVFKAAQIKSSDLNSFLALAGYDNSELRAKQAAYDALSASCQYTREPESE